jgi:hypothetical protein
MVEGINWDWLIIFLNPFMNINLVEGLDGNIKWVIFFVITTVLAVPGLLIIHKGTKGLLNKN